MYSLTNCRFNMIAIFRNNNKPRIELCCRLLQWRWRTHAAPQIDVNGRWNHRQKYQFVQQENAENCLLTIRLQSLILLCISSHYKFAKIRKKNLLPRFNSNGNLLTILTKKVKPNNNQFSSVKPLKEELFD